MAKKRKKQDDTAEIPQGNSEELPKSDAISAEPPKEDSAESSRKAAFKAFVEEFRQQIAALQSAQYDTLRQ